MVVWDAQAFGARLRLARESLPRKGSRPVSREKAAVALGFTRNTLDNYERGVTSPTVEAVAHMATFYGVGLGWLVGATDEGAPVPPPVSPEEGPTEIESLPSPSLRPWPSDAEWTRGETPRRD
jgi:transcriptional regulator with XRE-family HTH domain